MSTTIKKCTCKHPYIAAIQRIHDSYIDLEGNLGYTIDILADEDSMIPTQQSKRGLTWEDGFKEVTNSYGLIYREPTND